MQAARLIPVSGIGSEVEAEQRATSALLAVTSIVRDLSTELLSPLGASRAQRAIVETFTEVVFSRGGRKIRPDGLIRVSYGKNEWTCLVEVKTRDATLGADQVNEYWDLARAEGFDHVLTISNEIAPVPGAHPTEGLRVRSNSKVGVSHLSWTAILTTAIRIKQHAGVDDPEQAWILGELIRYLEHPASGALAFEDMGPNWVAVRDGARESALSKRDEAVADVVARWDQLLRYAALKLGSVIGEDVEYVMPRSEKDPKVRLSKSVERLCAEGSMVGALRIPHTAGDIVVTADLKGRRVVTHVDISAPQDRGGRARVTWLVGQLKEAPGNLVVEAFPKNARHGITATLDAARDDRGVLLGEDRKEPHRFVVTARSEMGNLRKTGGRSPGFIDSVLDAIEGFYENVVQDITAWQAPAPKVKRDQTLAPEPVMDEEPLEAETW